MNISRKLFAALAVFCFLLLPRTVLAEPPAAEGPVGLIKEKAVAGVPSPMAKPAKFPAGQNPSAAKPAPKPEGGQPTTVKKPEPVRPSVPETGGAKPTVKPAVNPSAKPAVKPAVKPTVSPTVLKPAKKAKPAKKDQKKDKKAKTKAEKDKKKTGGIKIACKETAPFFPAKKVDDLIKTAKKYIGVKYVYGGASPKGFDCSGYIMYIFKQHGSAVPRTADDQYDVGKVAAAGSLVKGDLVFFSEDRREISHVGLYLGGGNFIHASSSKGIRIDSLSNSYWKPRYAGAKHVVK